MISGEAATLWFSDGAARVRFCCSEHSLLSVARELFPDYLDSRSARPPASGHHLLSGQGPDVPPALEVTVLRTPDGFEVSGPVDEPVSKVDEDGAVSQIERRLALALLRGRAASYHLHAAALGTEGGAVLALGESGSGKSTIAFHWLLSGRPVLADDVVTLSEQGVVEGFRRRVKVDVGRVIAAGLDPQSTVAWREDADECWIDPLTLGGWSRPLPPRAIVRVRYDCEKRLSSVLVAAHEGLGWMLEGHVDTGVEPAGAFSHLTAIAERVPSFDLVYDDASQATEAIARLAF